MIELYHPTVFSAIAKQEKTCIIWKIKEYFFYPDLHIPDEKIILWYSVPADGIERLVAVRRPQSRE